MALAVNTTQLETILGWGGLLIICQVCSYYWYLMQNITAAVDISGFSKLRQNKTKGITQDFQQ